MDTELLQVKDKTSSFTVRIRGPTYMCFMYTVHVHLDNVNSNCIYIYLYNYKADGANGTFLVVLSAGTYLLKLNK